MKINKQTKRQRLILITFYTLIPVFTYTSSYAQVAESDSIDLQAYLQQLKENHPFFKQQALNSDIERAQQQRFLGDQDWVVKSNPSYNHTQRSTGSAFVARRQNILSLNAGLERHYWSNGGRLSVGIDYSHVDQQFALPSGYIDEHANGLNINYAIPLMQNKGGILSRLDHEMQTYNVSLSDINSVENQELFLEQQGLLFLDWVLVTEQRRIANNRLALAEEELVRTNIKRRSRLVAKVDVLRARDAVINAKQKLGSIKSLWRAIQAELATHSANPALYKSTPAQELYKFKSPPPIAEALAVLQKGARKIKALDLQLLQMDRLKDAFGDQLKPQFDLVIGSGLGSEDDDFSGSIKFDQPQYMLAVNFRYPIGQRSAKADVRKVSFQKQQLVQTKNNILLQLEAQLRNLLVQLDELRFVIELNKDQIDVARLRTEEELKRHNQGRSELSFVIQSRDNEQNAQLAYAANAVNYQKLWLRFEALTDSLFQNSLLSDSLTR